MRSLLCVILLALMPALLHAGEMRAYAGGPAHPRTPGFHKLVYHDTDGETPRSFAFSVFLPSGYGQPGTTWPMVTFLGGLGDRGDDPGVAMCVGVPLEIGRDDALRQWMPMIVLTPQCPSDRVWETPGMPQHVLKLIDAVTKQFDVDPSRLYLTGFSNGGLGAWAIARADPQRFAAIAPIVSREYEPAATAEELAAGRPTCIVISGTRDAKSEPASSRMVAAAREKGLDVVYAPVPDGGHFIWSAFYRERAFYELLLQHQRPPKDPPGDRLTGEALAALYAARQQTSQNELVIEHRLQRDLDRLEPYWFVDNCARLRTLGTQRELLGRTNVYATKPLSQDVACRLQTTRQLPADKITTLHLEVGHPPAGEWELVVRVNEQERHRTLVNDTTAPDGWLSIEVDLSDLAGAEARLQLIHNATENRIPLAFWSQLKLIETKRGHP